jgi:hypothetical protein
MSENKYLRNTLGLKKGDKVAGKVLMLHTEEPPFIKAAYYCIIVHLSQIRSPGYCIIGITK